MTPAEFATLQATEVDLAEWQAAGRPAGLALVMLAKRGHTRVALARRLGVSTQMVKAWEIGRNRPVTKHAAELERMLADVGPVVLRKPDTLPDAAVRRTRRAGNLRRLRDARGWNAEEMGHACGICASFVREMESGRRTISMPTIDRIADALKFKPSHVLAELDRRSP